ncbi:hypothetical protein [Clostridium sp.]|uniref:hypothetical protein n=1 Tax=Clostridium sp. TaxID=1506 RepID=UPI00262C49E2|nr:hypothetical protein [Clostridium sp.]
MSGRKKKENSLIECLSIRVTKDQKDIVIKNPWIANEVKDLVRKHINLYVMKK